jgi:hypothetical protein
MELKDLQNAVLQKIGRNVLNFQKIEAMIKMSIAHNHVEGPVRELIGIIKEKEKAISKQSMGKLKDTHVSSLYLDRPIENQQNPDNVAWISYSVKLGSDEDSVRKRKSDLLRIVEERNRLIHKLLAMYDPSSIQSCEQMISTLDEQHDLLIPEYKEMQAICKVIDKAKKEAVNLFLNELNDRKK